MRKNTRVILMVFGGLLFLCLGSIVGLIVSALGINLWRLLILPLLFLAILGTLIYLLVKERTRRGTLVCLGIIFASGVWAGVALLAARQFGLYGALFSLALPIVSFAVFVINKIGSVAAKLDHFDIGDDTAVFEEVTTYRHGDNYYDPSFSIESECGEFLGEMGVGISSAVGKVGENTAVTALEVWLFDKNDIRTVTKVLMTRYAFNDQELRAKLRTRGDLVLVQKGEEFTLETEHLTAVVTIDIFNYGAVEGLPPDSYFKSLTLQLRAYVQESTLEKNRVQVIKP